MPPLLRLLPVLACLLPMLAWAAVEPTRVSLQLKWRHQFQFAGYYAALEQGYYRDAGLDVNILEAVPGQDSVQAVMQGKAEFGVGNSDLLLARHEGKAVVALAAIFQHSPACILAARGRGIRGVVDLAGRPMAYVSHTAELLAFLKRAGLDTGQLRLVPYDADNLARLEDGSLDAVPAYTTNEPYELEQRGIPFLEFRPISAGIDFYGDNLFTSEKLLRNRPEMVAAFRAASLKGWRYALEHQREMVDLILKRYRPDADRAHLAWEADRIHELVMPELVEIGYMSPERWRRIADTYAEVGLLPPSWKVAPLLYNPQKTVNQRHLYAGLLGTGALVLAMGGFILVVLRSRRRLAASQARFRRTESTLPGVLFDFIRHSDGREELRHVSDRSVELLGLTPEELQADARRIWTMIHPEDLAAFSEARESARTNRDVFLAVVRLILPDGRVRWMQFSARSNPVPDDEGLLWSGFMLDVTDRHLAEAARARSEGQYKALVAAMGEGVMRIAADGHIEDCNPAAERILGIPRQDLIGRLATSGDWGACREDGTVYPPEAYPLSITLRTGQPSGGDVLGLPQEGGGMRWLAIWADPLRSEDGGRLDGAVVTFADVTEKKESEALLRGILDAAEEGMLVVALDGQVLAYNRRFTALWDMPEGLPEQGKEALLAHVADRQRDPESFLALARSLYQSGEAREDELYLRDGRTFLRHTRPLVVGGKVARIWTFRDVTQLMESQKVIRDERARLRTLLETIPEPVWLKDPAGVYLACNPAFEKIYDLPESMLVGKTDHDLTDPASADFLREKDLEALAADRTIISEEWVRYPGGGEQVLMAKIKTPMRDGDGKLIGVLGVGRDITEERRALNDLEIARDQAEAANRAKSQFLSRMSHELRTPLNAIIGFSELLKLDTETPLTAQQREFVDLILGGGAHLLELVNEVLDLARVETGRLEITLEDVNLPDLMGECLDMSQPLAAQRGIHLEGASQARRGVRADRMRLRQVLLNLLSNAVKYNREGGTVSVSCSAAPGNRIHIAVSDTGPGIPEALQAEVFQPFQRLGAEKTGVEGTGIGLTISKRLMEAMGGGIGFQSRPNQGTTFWVELPATEIADPAQ